MRVLYVDDDRVNAVLFAEACRVAGAIELECADSGSEAHELVADFAPDLLVIDLHLPDTSGDRLLPELRRGLGRDVPAFLCTADPEAVGRAIAVAAGFDGCWCKPLDLAALIAELRQRAAAARPIAAP
ncbi:MAG: response regulator [Burkholderiales bacterium]|nr:response regulator [Burkholderiales bacterium]